MSDKFSLKKQSWRDLHAEKKKRRDERLIKKLDKEEAKKKKVVTHVAIPAGLKKEIKTCSIALPASILDNAQSVELRTYLAGQIARAACIYRINEIIVFDDCEKDEVGQEASKTCLQFARILQYLECPQYLRKHFFPIHNDLKFIGLVNPLDAPHHLRETEESSYREGITTNKKTKTESECYVNVGLAKNVKVKNKIDPGFRVTVKLEPKVEGVKKFYGTVVSPEEPVKNLNIYWGYSVRVAHSLTEVFTKSPYEKGYDLTIGTSDKGKSVDELQLVTYQHALLVFGGLKGLESVLAVDKEIDEEDPAVLFDYYINTCPNQGSRTIRTEEAVLISLAELRKIVLDSRWNVNK